MATLQSGPARGTTPSGTQSMATSPSEPAHGTRGHAVVAIVMAVLATVEVLYECVAIWRRARRSVTRWWDGVEEHEQRAAIRAAMRWLGGRLDNRASVGARGGA